MTLFYMSADGNTGIIDEENPIVIFDFDSVPWDEHDSLTEFLDAGKLKALLLFLQDCKVAHKVFDNSLRV